MSQNRFEESSIDRAPRTKEHPYLMVSKDLIRDKSISPECRWLITFLLCNVDHWSISVKQVLKEVDGFMGRDKVRKLFNEAIKAGYIKREEYIENGLKKFKYRVSELAEFKKCLPCTGFQGPENTSTLKKTITKEEYKKKKIVCPKTPIGDLSGSEVKKKDPTGKEIKATKEDLYKRAVQERKDWSALEIEEVWDIFTKYDGPVRDWWRFCEGTITNLRNKRNLEKMSEASKKQKSSSSSQKEKPKCLKADPTVPIPPAVNILELLSQP